MSTTIRSLNIKLGVDLTDAQKNLKKISADFKKLGGQLSSAGSALTKGITVPAMAAAAALGAVVMKTTAAADEIQHLSDVTGLSTDRLQELKYVGAALDVELESITGSQRFLTKAMAGAAGGGKEQTAMFEKLGVSIYDSTGHLRNSNDVFAEAIDALGRMGNDTERDAVSLKLFGKSALELNPLIKAGSAEIKKLTQAAHDNGAVMSGGTVKALDNFGDSLEAVKLELTAAGSKIAMALLPALERLLPVIQTQIVPAIEKIAGALSQAIDWFNSFDGATQKMILWGAGIALALGPALQAFGGLATNISAVLGLLGGAGGVGAAAGGSITGLVSSFALLAVEVIAAYAALAALGQGLLMLNEWIHQMTGTQNTAPTSIFGGKSSTIPQPTQGSKTPPVFDPKTGKPTGFTGTIQLPNSGSYYNGMDAYYKNLYEKGKIPIAGLTKTQLEWNAATDESLKKQKALENQIKRTAALEEFRNSVKSLASAILEATRGFANFAGAFDAVQRDPVSGSRLAGRMQGQLAAIRDWSSAMKSLQGKISGQLYRELFNLGPGAVDEIVALANDDTALKDYASAWQQKYDIAAEMGAIAAKDNWNVDQLIEKQYNTINAYGSDPKQVVDQILAKLRKSGVYA